MTATAVRLGAAAALLALGAILGASCNYTEGQCFPREDIEGPGSDGAGGSVIVPGWGGYGDVPPPEPQDADDPPVDMNCNKTEEPDPGNNGASCGDISASTITEGATYMECSGPCEAKCLSVGAGAFLPAAFPFHTTVPDSGEGKGGGWQVATSTLSFVRWTDLIPEKWSCTISIGMPLRTEIHGKITAEAAATLAALVATLASGNVTRSNPNLPPGIFCSKFKAEMKSLLGAEPLKSYGARMMDP